MLQSGARSGASWQDKDQKVAPLTETDILIVAPYNAQVAALIEALPTLRGRITNQDTQRLGTRSRDIESMSVIKKIHAARCIFGAGGSHRVDDHRSLLALKTIDSSYPVP